MVAIAPPAPETGNLGGSVKGTRKSSVQENQAIADLLSEIARLLSEQGAGEFRVRAYQNASKMLTDRSEPIREVLERDGMDGLVALPTIGHSIANLMEQYLRLGRIHLLDRLRGEENIERLFTTLPNVGPELARRIHEHLHVETLPALWAASRDGRLAKVPGMGRKRVQAVRECLTTRLQHHDVSDDQRDQRADSDHSVSISEILGVDEEYRRLASAGKLTKIAPRQLNPGAAAWLPVLHCERGDRHFTAMFSNTARAHQLNTTKDWVIIFRDDLKSHGQWTVITSQFGKLQGYRIVRGREGECLEFYKRGRHPN